MATQRTRARWRGAPSGRRRCAVRRSASRLRRSIRMRMGEDVEGAATARERRAGHEAEAFDRKAGTGERAATVRSAASRSAGQRVGVQADEGSEATEPRPRAGRGREAGTCKRSAQRARASAGDRDRHPKGEDRVSGLRGDGRGEAAPGGIEPGARSLDRAGAPIMPVGKRAISGRRRPQLRTGHTGKQAQNNGLLAVSDTDRRGIETASIRRRRKRRSGREAAGAVRCRRAASGARAAAARSAAPRCATPGTAQKKGPVRRRSEGPALMGCGSGSVRRRR